MPLTRYTYDSRARILLEWLAEDATTTGEMGITLMRALTLWLDTIPIEDRHRHIHAVWEALDVALDTIEQAFRDDDITRGELPKRH